MKTNFGSAVLLLSLSASTTYGVSHASTYENEAAIPSTIDLSSRMADVDSLTARSLSSSVSSISLMGAVSKMQSRDSLFSLLKRSYDEMAANTIPLPIFKRQAAAPPTNGSTENSAGMTIAEWDQVVNAACDPPIANLSRTVSPASDPAGVAVCYNIPVYRPSDGSFAADIRLYKVATGAPEWEAQGVRKSLSVVYEGAMVTLAEARDDSTAQRNRTEGGQRNVNKRQEPPRFQPSLLQTLRFTGRINPENMQNETLVNNLNILKLLLIPNLVLIGNSPEGKLMNASINAAQVNYVFGPFSNVTAPEIVAAQEAFALPGVSIAIIPVGMYLFSVYMILFLAIVGFGSWERYQFRMSYRRKQSLFDGRTGVGKI